MASLFVTTLDALKTTILIVLQMNSAVFWDVAMRGPCCIRCFGESVNIFFRVESINELGIKLAVINKLTST
jgi:hypothetical protein